MVDDLNADLSLNSICVNFGRRRALEQVSFSARAGEIIVLKGDNGAGKSTLLRVLAQQCLPSSGRVDRLMARQTIGFLPQLPPLYPDLSALAQLRLAAQLYAADCSMIRPWLARFGLQDDAGRLLGAYSRGMLQRVALVQALMIRPKLLLLDEPTTALDAASVHTLLDALKEGRDERITVIATHEDAPFLELAQRVIRLHSGQVRDEIDLDLWRRTLHLSTLDPLNPAELAFPCLERVEPLSKHSARLTLKPQAGLNELACALKHSPITIVSLARVAAP